MPSAASAALYHNRHSASSRRKRSVLLEEGVVKTIVVVVREQQTVASWHSSQNARVGMMRHETAYCVAILFGKNRTGHVKQFTTTGDHVPQRLQQPLLLRGKTGNIRGSPEPFDIRMPPHDAGSGAGRIDQHAFERIAIPPSVERSRIRSLQAGIQPQAFKIRSHA